MGTAEGRFGDIWAGLRSFDDAWRAAPGYPGLGMTHRRQAVHLLGETLRDIGILVFVFGPLDAFFQSSRPVAGVASLLAGVGLSLIAGGIIIEVDKDESQ